MTVFSHTSYPTMDDFDRAFLRLRYDYVAFDTLLATTLLPDKATRFLHREIQSSDCGEVSEHDIWVLCVKERAHMSTSQLASQRNDDIKLINQWIKSGAVPEQIDMERFLGFKQGLVQFDSIRGSCPEHLRQCVPLSCPTSAPTRRRVSHIFQAAVLRLTPHRSSTQMLSHGCSRT